MRFVVPAILLIVAVIHAMPVVGVAGSSRLAALYGVSVQEPNLEILLRHRAVLFGILAAFLAVAAFRPTLHGLALTAGFLSVASFLVVAQLVGGYNTALATVVRIDIVALVLLVLGAVVHVFVRGDASQETPSK